MNKETERKGALEAVLFAMGEPVSLQILAKALDTDITTALHAVESLKASYETEERGIQLVELEGSYQLCTKPQYYGNLITVAAMPEKPVLTDTLLETLSIVAYRQPVTKAEISRIRGVASDHAVSRLVEYGLVQEAGRLNAPGRPILFVTTREFLRRFGMDSLEQLPETAGMMPEQEEKDLIQMEEGEEPEEEKADNVVLNESDTSIIDADETDEDDRNLFDAEEEYKSIIDADETDEDGRNLFDAEEEYESIIDADEADEEDRNPFDAEEEYESIIDADETDEDDRNLFDAEEEHESMVDAILDELTDYLD